MDIATVTQIIGSLGFPICVAGWLLYYQKKSTDDNTAVLNKLCGLIEKLADKFEK